MIKTFVLNLWAPDQVASAEAKPAEVGASYQYMYSPESHELESNDAHYMVEFKFHSDIKNVMNFAG